MIHHAAPSPRRDVAINQSGHDERHIVANKIIKPIPMSNPSTGESPHPNTRLARVIEAESPSPKPQFVTVLMSQAPPKEPIYVNVVMSEAPAKKPLMVTVVTHVLPPRKPIPVTIVEPNRGAATTKSAKKKAK